MNTTELLAYWITEREAVRKRHDDVASLASWKYGYSDDPHMGLVRYCNVRREDDKVTRWLAEHWRPQHHAVWEIVMARMVNYIPTLEAVLNHWGFQAGDVDELASAAWVMKSLRSKGDKVWTSAYTISTCGQSMDKIDYMLGVVEEVRDREETWNKVPEAMAHFGMKHPNTLAIAHKSLMQVNGLGSFLAAQVVADLKNTAGHPLTTAEDWHTWSAHGPGSLKGLSEYFGCTVTPRLYHGRITECWQQVQPLLPPDLRNLHMQDFQNCLCEFSKFMRVRRGGHVRNKYSAG